MSLGSAPLPLLEEHGHGRIELVQALGQSCDVYFYELARRVGIDTIAAMARRFGLGPRARHRPARRAARADPDHGLEAGDARRELAEGRDAGLRHRPGLRAGDAAAARGDGRAAGQWRPRRRRPWLGAARARADGADRHPIGVPQASLDVVLARHARGGARRPRHRPRGGTSACPASRWAARPAPRRCGASRRADRASGRHKRKDIALGGARPRAVRLLRALSRSRATRWR